MVRQETIEISEQRTAFVWFFAQEVDWCMINCDKQRLQTSVSINLWKISAGHTGDWFDVKTASICTTELWDALKSFILTSLKFKVAPYPIIVSLDTLTFFPPVQENLFQFHWNFLHLLLLAKSKSLQNLSSIWSTLSKIQLCSQAGTLAAREPNLYKKSMYKEFWQRSFHTQVQMKFVLFESNRRW